MRKKGFTLIELLAVIVILAILALITVPIVLKLVNNARRDSSVRSAENYLDGVKKAVLSDSLAGEVEFEECEILTDGNLSCNDKTIPLTVDVDGKKPTGGTINFSSGTISDVTDIKFGKYFINGEVQSLVATTKKSEGDRPEGVFLPGDKITYKGERYYIIAKSDTSKDYVVAMKMWPLTPEEIESFGIDEQGKSHINVFGDTQYRGTVAKRGDYGIISWYSSQNCYEGYTRIDEQQCDSWGSCWTNYNYRDIKDYSGCPTSYDGSNIKVIVDNWSRNKLDPDDIVNVDGYRARLLYSKEALKNLGYAESSYGTAIYGATSNTKRWARGNDFNFWMMDVDEDAKGSAYILGYGQIFSSRMFNMRDWQSGAVRPVINLKKTAIGK